MDATDMRAAVHYALSELDSPYRRSMVAEMAKAWAIKLDKEIIDGLIARGETGRLKMVKPPKKGWR